MKTTAPGRVRVGVSACLLGQPVRYDGGHKRNRFVADTLGARLNLVPVCPEVELGLGTPRETLRLARRGKAVRLVFATTGEDITRAMREYARRRVEQLAHGDLGGFVLKRDSPSCGLERVKVFAGKGPGARTGRGIFAEVLLARFPNLPVEEEGGLEDALLCERFVERVFAYCRVPRGRGRTRPASCGC